MKSRIRADEYLFRLIVEGLFSALSFDVVLRTAIIFTGGGSGWVLKGNFFVMSFTSSVSWMTFTL